MRVLRVIFILAFAFSQIVYSQDGQGGKNENYPGLGLSLGHGMVFPTNSFVVGENMAGEPVDRGQTLALKMLWQNPGYKNWQRMYNIPYYGFGFAIGNLYNPQEIGYPMSLYGILGIPLHRWDKLEIYTELQFGLAANWKYYHPETNPMNIAIGSFFTSHINVGIKAFYPVGHRLEMGAGVSLSHFSNGGLERPNSGINMVTPTLDLKYAIKDQSDFQLYYEKEDLERRKEVLVMASFSRYQVIGDTLDIYYYLVGGLSSYMLWQNTNLFKSGFGFDLNYLTGLTVGPGGAPGSRGWENLTLGLGYQAELVFDRLSIVGGLGGYVVHKYFGSFSQLYQRLGVKFYVLKNLYAGVNVRTINFGRAEFLEMNMGYRIWSASRKNAYRGI